MSELGWVEGTVPVDRAEAEGPRYRVSRSLRGAYRWRILDWHDGGRVVSEHTFYAVAKDECEVRNARWEPQRAARRAASQARASAEETREERADLYERARRPARDRVSACAPGTPGDGALLARAAGAIARERKPVRR